MQFAQEEYKALLLSTFAGLSTTIGGGLAIIRRPDDGLLAFLLGVAIGVMTSLSIAELWLRNAIHNGFIVTTLSLFGGGLLYYVVQPFIPEVDAQDMVKIKVGENGCDSNNGKDSTLKDGRQGSGVFQDIQKRIPTPLTEAIQSNGSQLQPTAQTLLTTQIDIPPSAIAFYLGTQAQHLVTNFVRASSTSFILTDLQHKNMNYSVLRSFSLLYLLFSGAQGQNMASSSAGSMSTTSANFTISTSGQSFEELRQSLQQQAADAGQNLQASAGGANQLQATLTQLVFSIAQSIALGMVNLLENQSDAETIAGQLSGAIKLALEAAASSSTELSGIDADSISSEINSEIVTILNDNEGASAQVVIQQVAQKVVDIISEEFSSLTGGTFQVSIDVSGIASSVGSGTTIQLAQGSASSASDVDSIQTQIIDALQAGGEIDYSAVIQLLISLLTEGGESQFIDLLIQIGGQAESRQFLVQLLIRAFQNSNFPYQAFVNALASIPSGNINLVVNILADAIAGSQQEAPQLSESFVYAVSLGSGGLSILNQALASVAESDNGCQNLRTPLVAAQELAASQGASAQFLEKLDENSAITTCTSEGVQLRIQVTLLGSFDNPSELAVSIKNAAVDGDVDSIVSTLLEGVTEKNLANLKLTLEFLFKDQDVPVDKFVMALSGASIAGEEDAQKAFGDIFVDFSEDQELRLRLVAMIQYAFSQGTIIDVEGFANILTSAIGSGDDCVFSEVLSEALSNLSGAQRTKFIQNIESNDVLQSCIDISEDTPATPATSPAETTATTSTTTTTTTTSEQPASTPEIPAETDTEVEATTTSPEVPTSPDTPVVENTEDVPLQPTISLTTSTTTVTAGENETDVSAPTPATASPASPITVEGDVEDAPQGSVSSPVTSTSTPTTTTTTSTAATATAATITPTSQQTNMSELSATFESLVTDNDNLTTLYNMLIKIGFSSVFAEADGKYTIFAPTNQAFNVLSKDLGMTPEELASDDRLQQIVLNHVVSGRLPSTQFSNGDILDSLDGKSLNIDKNQGQVSVSTVGSTANVVVPDVPAGDEIIVHVVDEVLLPFKKPELKSVVEVAGDQVSLSTFVTALDTLSISFPSNVFTIFAPNNAAFEAALASWGLTLDQVAEDNDLLLNIIQYHIVPDQRIRSDEFFKGQELFSLQGGSLEVEVDGGDVIVAGVRKDANVVSPDFYANNAIIHIVDKVLEPYAIVDMTEDAPDASEPEAPVEAAPTTTSTTVVSTGTATGAFSNLTIIQALQDNDISLLFSAIMRSQLESDLSDNSRSLTLFAPTTRALEFIFTQLGTTLDDMDVDELTNLLLQHLVVGKYMQVDLTDGLVLPTLLGQDLTVDVRNRGTFISSAESEAKIQIPDIEAGDSVVHVIDAVLVPGEEEVKEPTTTTSEATICEDVTPPGEYTCEDQVRFGKCNEPWMIDGDFCQKSCNRCDTLSTAIEEASRVIEQAVGGENGVCGCTCDEDKFRELVREVMLDVMNEFLN
eukprot:TRINITY_DN45_c4_g1_i2.p1 TRINITY_DN45_c4_g1~~TRINITY_DN45_c4_g1_i2.p1  ORF type:complete len:1543 (-),score=216.85 TRINITY_DN45_c4_g1_i2:1008-5513(-)